MPKDTERRDILRAGMAEAGLDALICTLPTNVLLLTGYFPMIGTAVAICTRSGESALLLPRDERALAEASGADHLFPFEPGSLDRLLSLGEAIAEPMKNALSRLRLRKGSFGVEGGPQHQPASYASMNFYGVSMVQLLNELAPAAEVALGDELLAQLRSVKTKQELERIRTACGIAADAYEAGAAQLRAGLTELEAASHFRMPIMTSAKSSRSDGFVWCMSGPNAATAYGAYARSRHRAIEPGDHVLTHCNSHADGFWTDITRTFTAGTRAETKVLNAVLEARAAALAAIQPGVKAAAVDRAARDVLRARGYGKDFLHATGHGVGFAAIDHNARPRLHPMSEEVLGQGMVFNVEPGVYLEGQLGVRHCDMVAVTASGYELLTPFQSKVEELLL